jgi:uncharacterized protein YdhG (YjbR/CyaY superfamily)
MEEKNGAPATVDEYIAQFPLDKPIPYDLISKIVRFRVGEK